ncbi:hypothetical protein EO763_16300 [Pectobacterium odoriferum]|nr:hypothetical protein EO763_16300 [Pectobacterium odoriferum]
MRDILSLTEGQPLAGQIRSRRICPSLAAYLKLELFRVYMLLGPMKVRYSASNSLSTCISQGKQRNLSAAPRVQNFQLHAFLY